MPQFFVIGCQRSGTTLLRLILESHPQVTCLDELLAYQALQGGSAFPNLVPGEWLGYKIPRFTEQFADEIWADEGIEERFPNPYCGQKILFMLRNPADSVASMIKLKVGTTDWLETWGLRIVKAKANSSPSFASEFREDLEYLERAGDRRIAGAGLYWKYKTGSFLRYHALRMPVMPICYEHLVTDPECVLTEVCRFLGLPWDPVLLSHNLVEHSEVFASGLTVGGTDPRAEIHSRSLRQWPRYITPEQWANVESTLRDVSAQLAAVVPELSRYWQQAGS